ncbi:hypothetical protein [Xylophilus sp. GOD-11R]|uniref:hypothetical protein n=1 Tax=Xylophilus sp. GOD-11R TaxID=3089814 RepID=UPI00298C985F|nr:hypothetical protein [Xylophilus sp. GOD-11R]WPB55361.1 hypothetical protein R9X41_14545 [Xylophilus sp. GOD-11R]
MNDQIGPLAGQRAHDGVVDERSAAKLSLVEGMDFPQWAEERLAITVHERCAGFWEGATSGGTHHAWIEVKYRLITPGRWEQQQ